MQATQNQALVVLNLHKINSPKSLEHKMGGTSELQLS